MQDFPSFELKITYYDALAHAFETNMMEYTFNQFRFCYWIQNTLSKLSNKLILRSCVFLNISNNIDENL